MNYFFAPVDSDQSRLQSLLLRIAAIFLFLVSAALTLTPAVRLHSWQGEYRFYHWIGFIVWLGMFSLIHHQASRKLPEMDPYLLPVTSLLSGWGLLSIWRMDVVLGARQSIWLVIAATLFLLAIRYPQVLPYLRRYKYIWLISGLILTGLTFLIGTYPGGVGPNLWLNFGGVYLQPSEPLKLLLIVYLSAYFADLSNARMRRLQILAPTIVLVAAAIFLLLAQRDLGTALVFLLLYFAMTFIATGDRWILLTGGLLVAAAGILGYRLYPVIQQRVNTWINPWQDPMGQSFQIIQSLISVASGGIFGRGAGLGHPTLVPIAHSDFIFSAIAEEYGLVGTFAVILLFLLLAFRSFRISMYAPNQFRRYLAAGFGAYFSIQAILIIGGNLNLLPLSGITLPFVSYGGSSLLVSFASLAVITLISDRIETEPAQSLNPQPYLLVSSLILYAWLLIAIMNGYWTLFRGAELTNRSDNLRLALNDRYVPRGNLVDRNNEPITETRGERGDYTTWLINPQLSPVVGFSSLVYGQSGLQASLDPYLRGLQGNPSSTIWWHTLLYAQRPPGLTVRLSLDMQLQNLADEWMQDQNGAIVMMNAETGEILTMASSPTFDANRLEENWEQWQSDPNSPFLNRATQGQYYPEAGLAPFILYKALEAGELPEIPQQLSYEYDENVMICTKAPESTTEWADVIANGCPGPLIAMLESIPPDSLSQLFTDLGFYQSPDLLLPVSEPDSIQNKIYATNFFSANIHVTPLQMAMAASALSTGGELPQPSLVLAVNTPHQGWVILSQGSAQPKLTAEYAEETVTMLSLPSTFIWYSTGFGNGEDGELSTWFIGGTTPDWQGSPLSIAVVLENQSADLVEQIGLSLLNATIHPGGE